MSTSIPVADPKRRFIFGGGLSPGIRLEDDLQSKRIKEVILPILAVLVGFFVLAFDTAILFTAVVIFGVFICGSRPLPPRKFPFSGLHAVGEPNPWRDIPSPAKPREKSTPYLHPATPVQGTPIFPTPGTVRKKIEGVDSNRTDMSFISQATEVSPNAFLRGLQRAKGENLETKKTAK